MGVGNKLKEIRLKEYMLDNKSEFAKILDVSIQTYTKWENGNTVPPIERALKISEKLNRTINDIWYLEK
ncbi:helix-turn-helix transcriptional regulator [Anaeromicrobium sediminis]|uniref:Transcriptional regulator n=1 Tax=Anaeromicrobium sediminis TaxID=1478221 RepID=A0A267MNK7_9FIRM|nr:helix-turn-helix domain-containing protein [Anaeromicrobium sediminis]PAB60982.1 transcriptional regulator [Anaeromicrobium sediminis]